jgi:hypothetical protein
MAGNWFPLSLLLVMTLGCQRTETRDGEPIPADMLKARVDSPSRAAADRFARRDAEVLNQPADYIGTG